MQTKTPVDFALAHHIRPGDTYEWSNVLLAKANLDGTLQFLTAAWERVLGYGRYEFKGKTLCQLMASDKKAAAGVVAAILDERDMSPVDVKLRCRGGRTRLLRLHRRLDTYTHSVFIVAEETGQAQA
jgi:PAS domain S-box-containing protein